MNYKDLKNIVGKVDKIYIDTCSLLQQESFKFFSMLTKIIDDVDNSIYTYIHTKVKEEVISKTKDKNLYKKASIALEIIDKYTKEKYFGYCGSVADDFADAALYGEIKSARLSSNVLLITDDSKLTTDVLNLNQLRSQRGKEVICLAIRKFYENIKVTDGRTKNIYEIPEKEKFLIKYYPILKPNKIIKTNIPKLYDCVFNSSRKKIKLIEQIGFTGGEGTAYLTDHNLVCKIYSDDKLDIYRQEKLLKMISKPINCEGICWPKDIVRNNENVIVGYIMPLANGVSLEHLISDRREVTKYFSKRIDLVNLCISIVSKFKYLHDRNILAGDISSNNILFSSSKDIYFIDTDSFQIEDYPCQVYSSEFVCPEIIDEDNKNYIDLNKQLRRVYNEDFIIALIIFRILMLGIDPYIQRIASDEFYIDLIEGNFPYPLLPKIIGGIYDNAPADGSQYIWDHFPKYIKSMFYNTFSSKTRFKSIKERFTCNDWIDGLKHYRKDLKTVLGQDDEESLNILPKDFKREQNRNSSYLRKNQFSKNIDEQISKILNEDYISNIEMKKYGKRLNTLINQLYDKEGKIKISKQTTYEFDFLCNERDKLLFADILIHENQLSALYIDINAAKTKKSLKDSITKFNSFYSYILPMFNQENQRNKYVYNFYNKIINMKKEIDDIASNPELYLTTLLFKNNAIKYKKQILESYNLMYASKDSLYREELVKNIISLCKKYDSELNSVKDFILNYTYHREFVNKERLIAEYQHCKNKIYTERTKFYATDDITEKSEYKNNIFIACDAILSKKFKVLRKQKDEQWVEKIINQITIALKKTVIFSHISNYNDAKEEHDKIMYSKLIIINCEELLSMNDFDKNNQFEQIKSIHRKYTEKNQYYNVKNNKSIHKTKNNISTKKKKDHKKLLKTVTGTGHGLTFSGALDEAINSIGLSISKFNKYSIIRKLKNKGENETISSNEYFFQFHKEGWIKYIDISSKSF